MDFVNIKGQPIDLAAAAKGAKRKASRAAATGAYHKGWVATGFPPQQLADAKAEHQRKAQAIEVSGRRPLPWDEERYMRDARPTKVRSKPYETSAAASHAATLAQQCGWKGCTWTAISKGDQ